MSTRIGALFEIRDGVEGVSDTLRVLLILAIVVCVFVVGQMKGYKECTKEWQEECISRGVAEYNKDTGVWQWKVEQLEGQPK